ncbi:hypothetical protein SASPL_131697 [Salvia splendens]|uniref:Peptidase S59 domain-containing protein n=1 Tax=Salvia splendens TaxID=180675 RepID=A0A8X8X9I5_SALSN|nr:hypothetical protein SASPL_131697 [Salvia splendens]
MLKVFHILSLLTQCNDVHTLHTIHAHMLTHGCFTIPAFSNKLINSYAHFNSLPSSQILFHQIRNPLTIHWNSIIKAFSLGSNAMQVINYYNGMVTSHSSRPNSITFSSVLKACGAINAGNKCMEIHGSMIRSGLSSDTHVSTDLIRSYAAFGGLVSMRKVFDEMTERELVTWNPLIGQSICQCPDISTTFTSVSAVHCQFSLPTVKPCFSELETENFITPKVSSTVLRISVEIVVIYYEKQNLGGYWNRISSVGTISFTEPLVIASSFMKSTPVTSSDPCSSFVNASQPQQTAEKSRPISTNDLNTPSQGTLLQAIHLCSPRHQYFMEYPLRRSLMVEAVRLRRLQVEEANGSVAPLLPRKNPRDWVNITSLSLHTAQGSKGDEVKDSCSSVQIMEINEDMHALLNQHEVEVAATTERRNADVLALLPKLPAGVEYYTEPSLRELAAKEMAEAGFCRHVKDFVVGRQGHGSITFLGETDVCHLDVESIVQLNNRKVIVYPNGRKKPRDVAQVNKTAEVTLLNVKCISKKTGKKYVEGPPVESYKEILVKMIRERGAEFDSYDPVEGELKFKLF